MATDYGYVGTYATPPHPYLPPGAMGSSGVSYAHRDRSRVNFFLFDFVSDLDVETRLDLYQYAISRSMDPCQLAWIHALFLA